MKFDKKKIIKALAIVLLIGSNVYLAGKLYFIGDLKERDKILTASIWDLERRGFTEDDIVNIRVHYYPPIKCLKDEYRVWLLRKDKEKRFVNESYTWDYEDESKLKLDQQGNN